MIIMAARRNRTFVTAAALAGALVGMVGLTGCGSSDVDAAPVERKTFAFSGESLAVDADNSQLTIVAADVKDVQVSRQVDGWVFMGEGPESSWKLEGGKLTLRTDCTGIASNCDARHEVKVPRGVAVSVEDDNGSVTADGFTTALKLKSDNGEVTVRNSFGPLELTSNNGSVLVERSGSRSVIAHSDNGEVRLKLTAVPDRVETTSDNGRVDIELPGKGVAYAVNAKSDNGDVDVDVPTDKGSAHVVTARSDNGEVSVRTAN
ncbi:DUF4097 family beta strand repeat-containing protein [Streptomyces purpureus]|uniref:DUF4097 family beta strand repeat-containing protein n=1 Tax=Streptomyces purpureus TaxID=1951 RepID=UPI0037B7D9ED